MDNRPGIGVAVVVVKDSKLLLGRDLRKGNVYGVPGGHWESGETLKECGVREVKEESGVDCDNLSLISVYEFYREDKQKSYITIGMKATYVSGDLTDLDEEGRTEWDWYSAEDSLRLNLFPADKVLIQRFVSGTIYE